MQQQRRAIAGAATEDNRFLLAHRYLQITEERARGGVSSQRGRVLSTPISADHRGAGERGRVLSEGACPLRPICSGATRV
ncbi:hypothetical protein CgunFtcFv8_010177 [Champsocephalus gunnari]|uniref:Uncharacterized protein n=1 Tax=Champsocephalus gunnari TaxID=52237 RepID=A0AAN8HVA3_CHAGU|nr:hypothetical protein CgunFtcFv8_010177 [Champsocephalus gunnari]